jgi:hypothetical protein
MARKTQIRRTRRTGGGYGTPGVYFNPDNQHPSSNAAAPSSDPVPGWVRPPLSATEAVSPDALTAPQSGGWRQTRRLINKMRGGFSPALMGSFVANAQAVVVPLALYGLYYLVAQKSSSGTRRNSNKNRGNNSK